MTRSSAAAWAWSLVRLDFAGVAFAALFFCLSLTPSLLPRDWIMGGVIGGINAAIGYGIGVLAGAAVRMAVRGRSWWPLTRRWRYTLRTGVVALSIGASVLRVLPAAAWQRQIAAIMGIDGPATTQYLRVVVVAVVVGDPRLRVRQDVRHPAPSPPPDGRPGA
jgi:uncharacterized membrane protein